MTQRHLTSFVLAGLALVAVAWLVRGSDGRAGPPGKSGGTAGLVLRLAVLEYPGKPAAQIAERYAQRVEDLSNGAIRVTITLLAHGLRADDAEQPGRGERDPRSPGRRAAARAHPVARVRGAGRDDVPAAPGAAADHLLGPGGSRHHGCARRPAPGRPDRARADRTGTRSRGATAALRLPEAARLAGRLRRGDDPRRLLASYPRRAADSRRPPGRPRRRRSDTSVYSGFVNDAASLPSADDDFPQAAHTAGNIALFPKIDVLVASTGAFGRLRPEQRAVLRRAAAEARAASIPAAGERAAAAAFCRAGGTIVARHSGRGACTPGQGRAVARFDAA